ncbi:MAG: TIR domain-containing protein [Acidimicrobiales bacterium]
MERLVDAGLKGTSVTAVLVGAETASRPWVNYEIEQSIKRGNGLLGICIHDIKDQNRKTSRRGKIPAALSDGGYRVYDWSRSSFGRWVEFAALDAGKPCREHDRTQCFMCRWLWWW